MRNTVILLFVFLVGLNYAEAQTLKGVVVDANSKEKESEIPFANVYWLGTSIGTVANGQGEFEITREGITEKKLIVSAVGFIPDTIQIEYKQTEVRIELKNNTTDIEGVTIQGKRSATNISTLESRNVQYISSDGIKRLACCSLAESFENNAAIDVGYTDAVSGAKQIQMLGLAGVYTQILVDNQPSIRILSSMYGLNYVPGPWLNGISISKGTASVYQGYESITGQINIDVKKPENSEKLYFEYFTNDYLKQEANLITSFKINDKLHSIVLLHGATVKQKVDRNNDSFLDVPLSDLVIASNRYFYNNNEKVRSRFGVDVIYEDRIGGQNDFDKDQDLGTTNSYGAVINTKRIQLFENTGFSVNPCKNSSIGINANFVYHEHNSQFGLRQYNATQKSAYLTALLNTDIFNDKQKLSSGLNFNYDHLKEYVIDTNLKKEEIVTGIFTEYIFNDKNKWSAIAGLRVDYNSIYGTYFTPRFNAKYTPVANSAIRVSAGRGLRSANIIPEHISLMASSRILVYSEDFDIEDAWNYGVSYTQKFFFKDDKSITVNIDFYRTAFNNKIVVDLEQSTGQAYFYNLDGKSYSNSFQTDVIIKPFKAFDVTLAYRFNDAKTTINNELQTNPLVARHKALMAMHYSTRYEKWNFSFTTQYHGQTKLPNTEDNPPEYRLTENSPDYFILHAQITLKFKKTEFYLGVENITNYKQKNPILAYDDPFGDYFDSSIVYAPIIGRQFNFGFRLKIK